MVLNPRRSLKFVASPTYVYAGGCFRYDSGLIDYVCLRASSFFPAVVFLFRSFWCCGRVIGED